MTVTIFVILAGIILALVVPERQPTAWRFTCPRCLRQVTFTDRGRAELCKQLHECEGK